MILKWLVPPLVGCIIGYITNAIAIKMLFRPHEEIWIRGFKVPFTPGLIPKNKDRLAAAIGDVISRDLLNSEVIEQALTSEEMLEKVSGAVDQLIEYLRDCPDTIEDVLIRNFGQTAYDEHASSLKENLVTLCTKKMVEADLGTIAAKAITEYVLKKSPSALQGLLSGLLDEKKRHTVTGQLREGINRYVLSDGESLVRGALDSESGKLLNIRIKDAIIQNEERIPNIKASLMGGYQRMVRSGTERVLNTMDISQIVRSRIASFDSRTIEKLVLAVMDRELKAIIWLGALLGLVMGFTNYFFMG